MGWVTKKIPDADGKFTKETVYWEPDIFPEPTEVWEKTQLSKSYLKKDGGVVPHPGWFYGNKALACDDYFYNNYGWLLIVDDRKLEDTDDLGNKYIIVENPTKEWEKFDSNKVRKTYKRYLYLQNKKPDWKYNIQIEHKLEYDEDELTVTDVYIEKEIEEFIIRQMEINFLDKIRIIRNYLLEQTDYLVLVAKEKNTNLSNEFLEYRQTLRDLPTFFDITLLGQGYEEKINSICSYLDSKPSINRFNSTFNLDFLSIPKFPTIIFE